jgi:hypothetical protein
MRPGRLRAQGTSVRGHELPPGITFQAIVGAGFVAYGLRAILGDLGLSDSTIVGGAFLSAGVLGGLVAIEFFGKKLGGPKR